MSVARSSRNSPCYCGSGKKFKHCCSRRARNDDFPLPQPPAGDGHFVGRPSNGSKAPEPAITRVAVSYSIHYLDAKAEVVFCYPVSTRVIMADGSVLPVEWLRPGMRFRLEDGNAATVTNVEPPQVFEPSTERDEYGNTYRRVIGRVKYTGHFPRIDVELENDVIKTTPDHRFWSVDREQWAEIKTFRPGEFLETRRGVAVRVKALSPIRIEFCDLYGLEVEQDHTFFVGKEEVWTHNGMGGGCRVPRAMAEEALENGEINRTTPRLAGVQKPPDHHIFAQEFRDWLWNDFKIDVDRFQVRLTQGVHEALHYKMPGETGGGFWNNQFLKLFAERQAQLNGQAMTRRDVLRIGVQMRARHLDGMKLNPV